MATVTKGKTFISGETVEPADMHQLVDAATVTNIVDADISATAAIALSKLATGALPSGITVSSSNTQSLVPAGAVMPFAMNSAPSGWLAANGDAVSRSTYAALFSAIGTTHGVGDGSTTFNLPDLRGIFVRGSGSQTISGTTYSGTLAAKQSDLIKDHRHLPDVSNRFFNYRANVSGAAPTYNSGQSVSDDLFGTATGYVADSLGGAETRPANIALLYCIKF